MKTKIKNKINAYVNAFLQKHKFKIYLIKGLLYALGIIMTVNLICLAWQKSVEKTELAITKVFYANAQEYNINVPYREDERQKEIKSVKEKIIYYADIFGVEKETALRIAECESNFNPSAENINGSATGIYQFIRKTWKNNCEGDVYNADANIICFMRMYPIHKEWWECK